MKAAILNKDISMTSIDRDVPSEMVERVKQAIHDVPDEGHPDPDNDAFWSAIARAAIEAMREPTEAMLKASWATVNTTGHAGRQKGEGMMAFKRRVHNHKTAVRYQAMIDAVLTNGDPNEQSR